MRRIAALAASIFVATGLAFMAVGTANASTTFTATTHLTNRLDSGNNALGSNVWATDTLDRTMTLVDLGPDVNRSGYDTFSASLVDTGTFVTNSNVGNPNGLNATTPITGTVTGSVNGSGSYTKFDAPHGAVDSGLVPASMDGNVVSSSDWPSLFFPKSTDFECPGIALTSWTTEINPFGSGGCGSENTFSYTYKSCSETWLDANTDNDGDAIGQTAAEQATIGGISGKACPAPAPTPTPTPTGTPGTTGGGGNVPTGAPATGGGTLPAGNPTGQVVGIVILLGVGLSLTVGYVLRRIHQN